MANVAWPANQVRYNDFSLLAGYGLGIGYMSIIGPLKTGIMHGIATPAGITINQGIYQYRI